MELFRSTFQIFVTMMGCLAGLTSVLFFVRLRWPAPVLWFTKLYIGALSPLLLLIGVLTMVTGLVTQSLFITATGIYDVFIFSLYIFRVTRAPVASGSFDSVFGPDWERRINAEQSKYFLSNRAALKLPSVPAPAFQQNLTFAIVPHTGRKLLCDLWQPGEHVRRSGLAFIYLHGSAFFLLDKDMGTRPFFRHLAAQGHVVMDVAYRLSPETDVMGMVNDVKRAIVWMKENAGTYKINTRMVALGGGSAGGHLALLAAYTANNPEFAPQELEGRDTSVCAVCSLYGSSDMASTYFHTNQHLTTRSYAGRPKKAVPTKMPGWIIRRMGEDYYRLGFDKGFENAGALAPLLGGHPDECPETYARYSVITHVHAGCPPTYLIHGEHDIMAPVKSTRTLFARLTEENIPVVMHLLPQTEHAFDLILPNLSPAAHTEFYELERFLALQAKTVEQVAFVSKEKKEAELID